jgi:hypothetical protein
MMKHLLIANKGEVEIQALTLLGASTKRDDETKIGMFGSGNKYALAYLTRNNIPFVIYSGEHKIEIGTAIVSLRGTEFKVFTINGERTSITTEFGKDWKLWESLREFYSNAIDEGIVDFKVTESVSPVPGETHIYIDITPEVDDFLKDFDSYFSRYRKPIFTCETGSLFSAIGPHSNIYRKGIKCVNTERTSIFDYDFNSIDIDENRRVSYSWKIVENIWKILLSCDDVKIIRKLLNGLQEDDNQMERDINSCIASVRSSWITDHNVWVEAIGEHYIATPAMTFFMSPEEILQSFVVPHSLYVVLTEIFNDRFTPPGIIVGGKATYKILPHAEITSLHKVILNEVLDFFRECQFKIPFPIEVAEIKEKNILGTVNTETGTIILGTTALDKGKSEVASTIIEEMIHLKFDAPDNSRLFQSSVIGTLLNYMMSQNAITL